MDDEEEDDGWKTKTTTRRKRKKRKNNMKWIKKTTGVAYNGIIAMEQRLFSADCHTQTWRKFLFCCCCCSAVLMVVFVGCGFATYILWLVYVKNVHNMQFLFFSFCSRFFFLAFLNHNNISVHRSAHIQSFRYAHITKLKKLEAWVNKNECENA